MLNSLNNCSLVLQPIDSKYDLSALIVIIVSCLLSCPYQFWEAVVVYLNFGLAAGALWVVVVEDHVFEFLELDVHCLIAGRAGDGYVFQGVEPMEKNV